MKKIVTDFLDGLIGKVFLGVLFVLWLFWGVTLYKEGVAIDEKWQQRQEEQQQQEDNARRMAAYKRQVQQQAQPIHRTQNAVDFVNK